MWIIEHIILLFNLNLTFLYNKFEIYGILGIGIAWLGFIKMF